MEERPPINPVIQVQFSQQMEILFALWQEIMPNFDFFLISLKNRMPSTGKKEKQILYSLSERAMCPEQIGPSDDKGHQRYPYT